MSEFFLELFSEEIPANLQQTARNSLLNNFVNLLNNKNINFKNSSSYSVPNRPEAPVRIITWFDNFSLLLRRDGASQLVYKHAISTIMPTQPLSFFEDEEQ